MDGTCQQTKGRASVSSSSVSSGEKPRARAGTGLDWGHTGSLVRAGNGIPLTLKPQLSPLRSTADKQLTGTKEENEGQAGEERGLARPRMEQESSQ